MQSQRRTGLNCSTYPSAIKTHITGAEAGDRGYGFGTKETIIRFLDFDFFTEERQPKRVIRVDVSDHGLRCSLPKAGYFNQIKTQLTEGYKRIKLQSHHVPQIMSASPRKDFKLKYIRLIKLFVCAQLPAQSFSACRAELYADRYMRIGGVWRRCAPTLKYNAFNSLILSSSGKKGCIILILIQTTDGINSLYAPSTYHAMPMVCRTTS